uniref:Uncharacterized protein n=1 Tax=Nelumbo nucifera TaxID=4432 RepID=A0A822YJZ2_NELNU|nr:TPA_asm: hypothetical protein HUJ06_011678 [Nelumbo nucifera]
MSEIMNLPYDRISWNVLAQWLKTCESLSAVGFLVAEVENRIIRVAHVFWRAGLGDFPLVYGWSLADVRHRIDAAEARRAAAAKDLADLEE